MRRPVVQLKKALYGHPDSGTFWEKHCDKHVCDVGLPPCLGGVALVLLSPETQVAFGDLRR
eukprot:13483478-Heterocapsa_arctica.AAC.1